MDDGSDDSRSYIYSSLPGAHSIRILHLNAGRGDDPVSGVLVCVDFKDEPSYEALSYEWGNPEKDRIAFIDQGRELKITESLHHALTDIRDENPTGETRRIWADAVCIDQDNIEERQRQVGIMGDIYRNAARVITYIGPEADNSSLGIDFAYELFQYWDANRKKKLDPRLHIKEEMVNLGLPAINDPRWVAFRKLVTRGWASRCWCAQEYVLNKECRIMCGRRIMNEAYLIPFIVGRVFQRELPEFTLPQSSEDPISLRECITNIHWLRDSMMNFGTSFTLLQLLELCHPLRATDPRDKVYSLLALASDKRALSIEVDYKIPVEELFTKVAATILTVYPLTSFLYNNLGKKTLHLPSWVPDWSTWRFGSHGMLNYSLFEVLDKDRDTSRLRVDLLNKLLHVTGSLVDRVSNLSKEVNAEHLKAAHPDQKGWLQKQVDLLGHLDSYPDGTSLTEVLWRTLCTNLTLMEEEAGAEYETYFNAFQTSTPESPAAIRDMAREFRDVVRRKLRYCRLCITKEGYFGAMPDTTQIGDWICMFEGARSLFVVREKGAHFVLLGPAYVHGLINEEVFKMNGYERQTITLC